MPSLFIALWCITVLYKDTLYLFDHPLICTLHCDVFFYAHVTECIPGQTPVYSAYLVNKNVLILTSKSTWMFIICCIRRQLFQEIGCIMLTQKQWDKLSHNGADWPHHMRESTTAQNCNGMNHHPCQNSTMLLFIKPEAFIASSYIVVKY